MSSVHAAHLVVCRGQERWERACARMCGNTCGVRTGKGFHPYDTNVCTGNNLTNSSLFGQSESGIHDSLAFFGQSRKAKTTQNRAFIESRPPFAPEPMLLSRVLLRESRSLGATAKKIGGSSIVGISGGGSGSGSGRNSSRSSGGNACQHRPLFSSSGDGDDADQPLREFMATLGVYFTLPEQGVTSPEILTRLARVMSDIWYMLLLVRVYDMVFFRPSNHEWLYKCLRVYCCCSRGTAYSSSLVLY